MRLRDLIETSSAGSTSSGNIATVLPGAYSKPKAKKTESPNIFNSPIKR